MSGQSVASVTQNRHCFVDVGEASGQGTAVLHIATPESAGTRDTAAAVGFLTVNCELSTVNCATRITYSRSS
jgi:hypothetical protein